MRSSILYPRSSILYLLSSILVLLLLGGCVDRMLTIDSNPPGAVVYLNDQELGRTPLNKDFSLYGNYEVQIRKDGYNAVKTTQEIQEPWWQLIPLDLATELLPFRFQDRRHYQYTLTPMQIEAAEPHVMLSRAAELRGMLVSSPNTRIPATVPTTQPGRK